LVHYHALKKKLDTFIDHGAKHWYHGDVPHDEALNRLKKALPVPLPAVKNAFFLVRDSTQDFFTQEGLLYIFEVVTYTIHPDAQKEPTEKIFRIFANSENELCCELKIGEKNELPFRIIEGWNFQKIFSIINEHLQISSSSLIPVRCPRFSNLEAQDTPFPPPSHSNEQPKLFVPKKGKFSKYSPVLPNILMSSNT